MTTMNLFPELVQWLVSDGRALTIIPQRYGSQATLADHELFETIEAMLYGGPRAMPIAGIVRQLKRMLACELIPESRRILEMRGARAYGLLDVHNGAAITHLVDLGGCYLPGYGVPLLVAFAHVVTEAPTTVRVLRCTRGERKTPRIVAKAPVWRSVLAGWDTPGTTEHTVTVDVARESAAILTALSREEERHV